MPLLLLSILFYSSNINAQNNISLSDLMNESRILNAVNGTNNPDIKGSPYENDEFIKGVAVAFSDMIYNDVLLRLNIYNDQIEFKNDKGEILGIVNPDYFRYFEFNDLKIQYLPYYVGKKILKSYFFVKEEGEATLLFKPKVTFEEATKPAAYQEAKPAAFKRIPDEIFIKKGNEPAVEITNKKSLIEALSEKEQSISNFLKENKIKTSDPEDILKVVKYYNLK